MSVWDSIVGQEHSIRVLQQAVEHPQALTQSWLFIGAPGVGREHLARVFAAALQCPQHGCGNCRSCISVLSGTNPDVTILSTEKVTISIDDVRPLIVTSEQMPTVSPWNIIIIEDISRMQERTTNVLLKEVEEPADHTIWILCAPDSTSVLPTIRSRTRAITLAIPTVEAIVEHLRHYTEQHQISMTAPQIQQCARYAQGNIDIAEMYTNHEDIVLQRVSTVRALTTLSSTAQAIALAQELHEFAQEQGKNFASEHMNAIELEFRKTHGYTLDDKLPKPLTTQLRSLTKKDEEKRYTTRATRDVINRQLQEITSVYRDVMLLQHQPSKSVALVNEEFRNELIALSQRMSEDEAIQAIRTIEIARRRIAGNGAVLLDLEAMLASLIPLQ